ncbi:hypothetical protein [Escherichia coli]|uniref:hypothetical protein n=1 Tax=Escherichia coli TaxID=562 RepID=UPI000AB97512|nr:hypothetical protein [Escherichia coli]
MQVGAFGLGNSSAQVITDVWDKSLGSRFIMMSPSTSGGPQYYSMGIRISERSWGNGPNDVSQQSFSAFSMGRFIDCSQAAWPITSPEFFAEITG